MGPARIHPAFNMHPNFLSLAGFVLTLCHLVYLVTLMKVKINHVCTENRCPSWFPPFQLWCGWVCCCGMQPAWGHCVWTVCLVLLWDQRDSGATGRSRGRCCDVGRAAQHSPVGLLSRAVVGFGHWLGWLLLGMSQWSHSPS